MNSIKSECRICMNCGFQLDVENNSVVSFKPDTDHPLSHGYACPKGIAGIELLQGKGERDTNSYKRNSDGQLEIVDPLEATSEIGSKLADIVKQYGPRSVALFYGTGAYGNTLGSIFAKSWLHAVGSKNLFTSATIDQSCHWITALRMGMFLGGEPDVDDVDVALVAGANPMVAHSSTPLIPMYAVDVGRNLNKMKQGGQKVIVVDPRKTETARLADLHLQIIPGEDATLFAGLLHLLFRQNSVNQKFCQRYASNVERLQKAVEDYTPDYVSQRTGVPVAQLEQAAQLFGAAKKPHAGCSTGTGMAPDSNLADFLMEAMNVLCAGYKLGGEEVRNQMRWSGKPKVADVIPPNRSWENGYQCRTQKTGLLFGELPTALMPDEILAPGDDKIRALVVIGGNPAIALPDPDKTVAALKDLDLLVTLDHRRTETTALADYVISTDTQFERFDVNGMTEALGRETFTQLHPPVVNKPDNVIHDYEFFWEVAAKMGLQLDFKFLVWGMDYGELPPGKLLDMSQKPGQDELIRWLCEEKGLDYEELKNAEYGVGSDDPPGTVQIPPEDSGARLDLCPDDIEADIRRVRAQPVSKDKFRLTVRRIASTMNSHYWKSTFSKSKFPQNFAYMNPVDMVDEGLVDGSSIIISTDTGRVIGTVRQDDTVRQGVISMPHCYGSLSPDDDPDGVQGAHTGRLIPLDPQRAEAINYMPHMTGFPVSIERRY